MTLFTKPDCKNCEIIKEAFNLKELNIDIEVLTPDNIDALAHLAWHELVDESNRVMPILVLDDSSVVKGVDDVSKYLSGGNDENNI